VRLTPQYTGLHKVDERRVPQSFPKPIDPLLGPQTCPTRYERGEATVEDRITDRRRVHDGDSPVRQRDPSAGGEFDQDGASQAVF
jgi:hypothetical protein